MNIGIVQSQNLLQNGRLARNNWVYLNYLLSDRAVALINENVFIRPTAIIESTSTWKKKQQN